MATDISPAVELHTMVQLLRRNATVFLLAFALLWSVRFVLVAGMPEVVLVVAVAGVIAVRIAFRATTGPRARDVFRTPEGRRFLRPVTRLTVIQVVASIVLPVIAGTLGKSEWVMPLVAATIGLFLVGFSRLLQVPAVASLGALGTMVPLTLPLLTHSDTLLAATGDVRGQ